MARLRGFEPLTAWFVARYSIQLSYKRVSVACRCTIYSDVASVKSQQCEGAYIRYFGYLSQYLGVKFPAFLLKTVSPRFPLSTY